MRQGRKEFPSPLLVLVLVLGLALGLVLWAGPALGEDPSFPAQPPAQVSATMVFILDGSGSMWGRIDGQPKIVIAKEVLSGLIPDLGPDTDLGLVSYGHRRKSDCNDVEILAPLGQKDRGPMLERLNSLNPKGMTPISQALRQAVDMVKDLAGPATLILVSDGKETCGGDPCWLVEHLRRTVFDFTLHVIGFDVTQEETEQLECMARAGGGRYFSARSALELEMAVRQLAVETLLPEGPALAVGTIKNGKAVPAQITVLTQGKKDLEVVRFGDTERFNPQMFYLDPGVYEIRVTDESTPRGQTLTRRIRYEGVNKAVLFYFEEGRLLIKTTKNDLPALAQVDVLDNISRAQVARTDTGERNPVEMALPPGKYLVQVKDLENPDRPIMTLPGVEVENNRATEKEVDFPEGTLLVFIRSNGAPARGGLDLFDSGTGDWLRSADSAQENPVALPLLPGEYDLKVVLPGLLGRPPLEFRDVMVEPGQKTRVRADFQEAVLSLKILINGEPGPGGLELTRSGTDRPVFSGNTAQENPLSLRLAPGAYDLTAVDPNVAANPFYPSQTVKDLEIRAGEDRSLTFAFEEGTLTLSLKGENGEREGVYYVFSSGTGEEQESGAIFVGRPVSVRLEPGLYDAVVEIRQGGESRVARQEGVEVKAAETALAELAVEQGP